MSKKMRSKGEAQHPGMVEASKEIAAIRELTAKQLVVKAKEEFGQHLSADNGRTWLLKKVGYMIQEKYMGMSESVKQEAASLETEEKKTQLKKEEAKVELLKAAKHKPKKESASKDTQPRNEVGSILGSRRDVIYQMLRKGCNEAALAAEKDGKGIAKWLTSIKGLTINTNDKGRMSIA